MRYQNVYLEALAYTLPSLAVTSAELEQRLAPVYQRLGLSEGRLELMTGIRERRFWEAGDRPGPLSAVTARKALIEAGLPVSEIGALIHGSVCRDQLEPATAAGVHHALRLPSTALVLDVSNACLGLLNGVLLVANLIELGQVSAGVIVGTELGRDLVDATIDSLLASPEVTRQDMKSAFASLTIGSGSAAIVLCHRNLSRTGHRLIGGAHLADTSSHELCAGGSLDVALGDSRPLMQTDSEALLNAGVALAQQTWTVAQSELGWSNADVDRAFTHQVGQAHRRLLYERLGLDPRIDFATVETLGNTGAAALPLTAAIGWERGHVRPGDHVAWLGIGSGLSSIMLGWEW